MPRICTVHEDHPLTRQEIQSILSHADPLMRALILLLASSGMRIGEALSICPDDIRLGEPSAVHLSRDRMKARTAHTYYFSSEAQAAISEWLKVRDAYLTTAGVRTRLCLKHKTSRSSCIFPLSAATIREKFVRILKAAKLYELCEESGRATITLHSFRKWSESTMKLHIPINVANELIGHDEGLSKSYRRYSDQQIKAAYLSVEPHLSVLAPPDYSELREHTASVLAEQQATTSAIAAELVKMKAELDEIRMFMHTSE
ncbi:MAG TPA: site-specific integrase [Methanocorpusculum sp.]|nr:site-specific integrase [Methanocorpusculum sp.]HJK80539.1 site-specific integrase [Methanocorpusculum sp.]